MTYVRQENLRIPQSNTQHSSAPLPAGTVVLTLRGALPVENLRRGDRVCTPSGATPVKRIYGRNSSHFTLEFDNHEVVYVLDRQTPQHRRRSGEPEQASG